MAQVTVSEPEVELLQRLRAGDVQAFERAARGQQARLVRLAGRFVATAQDAEDVVQDALVAAYRQMRRFRGQARFGTWLAGITIRKALRAARKAAHVKATVSGDTADASAPDQATAIAMRAAVEHLPTNLRAPVVLRFYEGLSGREIAELLGCRQSTVWTRIYRALQRLKADMEEDRR
jgi:RNA polymerase sigma-70 factor (ECF subfamily)